MSFPSIVFSEDELVGAMRAYVPESYWATDLPDEDLVRACEKMDSAVELFYEYMPGPWGRNISDQDLTLAAEKAEELLRVEPEELRLLQTRRVGELLEAMVQPMTSAARKIELQECRLRLQQVETAICLNPVPSTSFGKTNRPRRRRAPPPTQNIKRRKVEQEEIEIIIID